ncbi:muscle, skeletal receptor tyrosine protein kinase [Betta splendens]|uniref:Muscle, skeletal receptor tyrosine protein kinase n=1 Tax=Betta splendens TaxID=158456 RepID=A0A6P7MNQ6_BETSP|nr:muscle, skeletal receptor tyrosine protein kinase [Betta splendens]
MLASLFVVVVGLCYCSTESSEPFLWRPQLYGPSEGLVTRIVQLQCELLSYPKNESVLLQLFKTGTRTRALGEYTLHGRVATFNLVLGPHHDGSLECVATLQNNTLSSEAIVSNSHHLKVVVPVRGARIEVLHGSLEFFEGRGLTLRCTLQAGTYVSYKWFLNDRLLRQSQFRHQVAGDLRINRTTSKDSGSYRCVAANEFNGTLFTSNASEVVVTVKDAASEPDISFVVLKEGSHDYSAVVTCQSARGATPITFSLYNGTGRQMIGSQTSGDREATFKLPVELGRHMGWIRCNASNGAWPAHSQWLPLEVVPVSGPVNISYDYDTGQNYAVVHLRFHCRPAKGSHARFHWFLNDTLLPERGSFYRIIHKLPGESQLELHVEGRSAGTYRCEAYDSFDNSTGFSSKKQYMDEEVLNRLPVLVVAVVFGCFIFLILLVSVCCWFGVMRRRRLFGDASLFGLDIKKNIILYEGELDLLDNSVDEDLGKTTSRDDSDQASEPSVDEWLHMAEQRNTMEDGPIEFP